MPGELNGRASILSLILSGVSVIALGLAMWILTEIQSDLKVLNMRISTHLENHPDRLLDRRLTIVEVEMERLKGAID